MGLPLGWLGSDSFIIFYIWGIAHQSQEGTVTYSMDGLRLFLKCIVTFLCLTIGQGAFAVQNAKLDALFERLVSAEGPEVGLIEQNIIDEFSRSGSDAMDLLLERGRNALEQGDSVLAVEHLTALIDHAPAFAEGYNARATAYFHSGLLGAAMADIGQTLTLEPRHFGAMSGMALILAELGRYESALKVLQSIQTLHPNMIGLSERIERLELELVGAAL
jgi:tetratricopeptide (TPR) repeat protein